MGLKDLFSRWSKSSDKDALERAGQGDHEDYEAKKDDAFISSDFAGAEAKDAAADDLGAP
jgi:hypothetical protein